MRPLLLVLLNLQLLLLFRSQHCSLYIGHGLIRIPVLAPPPTITLASLTVIQRLLIQLLFAATDPKLRRAALVGQLIRKLCT